LIRVRSTPEDFRVEEVPLYAPCGEGEHTFVRVEKRLRSTEEVARELARVGQVPRRDVGYAGRKDREAVTQQWFSVPGLDPESARALALPGIRVLEAARHRHKLRTGQLRANRFELVVRDVGEDAARAGAEQLLRLEAQGMPNRFGPQRFGRDGANPELGRAVLRGERGSVDRRTARFWVSALQAEVFNAVLARRPVPLDALEPGDVCVVHASGGLFVVEDVARETPRARAFEISATGPLFGTRGLEPAGVVAERERAVLQEFGIESAAALRPPPGLRLRGGRRPFRVRPEQVSWEREPDAVRLRFTLPPGSYATVLLEELFGPGSVGADVG
jgi:tRNA pseudouridine13 synthase